MIYLKTQRHLRLNSIDPNDPTSAVRKFVGLCRTSAQGGTSQSRKLPCIEEFLSENGFKSNTQTLGAFSQTRGVEIGDLRNFLKRDAAVILHVAWIKFDSKKNKWISSGSHSLNAYGYDYEKTWGNDKIILKVSNPGMNYSGRNGSMLDSVALSALPQNSDYPLPRFARFRLDGPGFNRPDHIGVLEDIFVFEVSSQD